MLHEVSSFCRAFKGYRVHCRDTQMFPVVPRHTLASNIKDPFRMERHKRLLWALKRLILLSFIFLDTLYEEKVDSDYTINVKACSIIIQNTLYQNCYGKCKTPFFKYG